VSIKPIAAIAAIVRDQIQLASALPGKHLNPDDLNFGSASLIVVVSDF